MCTHKAHELATVFGNFVSENPFSSIFRPKLCLVGANTFRSGAHPKWTTIGPKSITKKILTSSDTPNPSYVQLSPPKKATLSPLWSKGVHPLIAYCMRQQKVPKFQIETGSLPPPSEFLVFGVRAPKSVQK